MGTQRNYEDAYRLADYYRSQVHAEPDTDDVTAKVDTDHKGIRVVIWIPHTDS